MNSKFLLHGGGTDLDTESNLRFYSMLTSDKAYNGKLLLVYLAREKEKWDMLLEKDKKKFQKEDIELVVASDNLEILRKQIIEAGSIFIRGGLTSQLIEYFEQFDKAELINLLENKIIGASSAGAYIFSKYYYANSLERIDEGLGILPVKLICHFEPSLEEVSEKLEKYKEEIPMYKITEGDFVEYYVE